MEKPVQPPQKKPAPEVPRDFGLSGFGGYHKQGKKNGTEISDLSVANVAFPSLSIYTGKGEQSNAAKKLLDESDSKKKKKGKKEKTFWSY